MATYKEIQNFIHKKHGILVQTCWIADMKEYHNLPKRTAPNRISKECKVKPCPEDKRGLITEAFIYFNMIEIYDEGFQK